MKTKESDILHESGSFWVCRQRDAYTVFRNGATHATADSSYAKTSDGLSIAKARCDYLAKREAAQPQPAAPFSSHLAESLYAIGADAMKRAGATLGERKP